MLLLIIPVVHSKGTWRPCPHNQKDFKPKLNTSYKKFELSIASIITVTPDNYVVCAKFSDGCHMASVRVKINIQTLSAMLNL